MSNRKVICTKFNFGWGSVTGLLGELTVLPDPLRISWKENGVEKGNGKRERKREEGRGG